MLFPAQAQTPEPILVSPAERDRIVAEFGKMQDALEELAKRYKTCQSVNKV